MEYKSPVQKVEHGFFLFGYGEYILNFSPLVVSFLQLSLYIEYA